MSEGRGDEQRRPDWLPLREVAEREGLSTSTLNRWASQGKIRSRGLFPRMVDAREVRQNRDRSRGSLRDHRLQLGLSQKALGLLAGLSQPQVSCIERGERSPTVDELERLSGALATNAALLLPTAREPVKRKRLHGARLEAQVELAIALYRDGLPMAVVASQLGISETQVARYLDGAGVERPRRGNRQTLMSSDGGGRLREARLAARLTQRQLAQAIGVSESRISDLEGRWGCGVRRDTAERIAEHLASTLDDLGLVPGEVVVPPELVGRRSRPATPRQERYDGRHFKEAVAEAKQHARQSGLLLREQTAEAMGRAESSITYTTAQGRLTVAERRRFGPFGFIFYGPDAVKRLRRDEFKLYRGGGPTKLHRDPERVFKWALRRWRHELPLDELLERAEQLKRKAVERNERDAKIRIGTGRPKGPGLPAYYHHLHERLTRKHEELSRCHSEACELDPDYAEFERPPTRNDAALAVAEEHIREHPELWSAPHVLGDYIRCEIEDGSRVVTLNPQLAESAIRRVLMASHRVKKTLQNAVTETRAA